MNRVLLSLVSIAVSYAGLADQYHYNNVIVGDRAMGLGGAYAGVSDDSSGVVYNPAGLAFALSNDISGSANAFYKRQITYSKTIGDKDFTENSGGSLAPFFGGLQKLDMLGGVVFAWGISTIDSDLKDQNDTILEASHKTKTKDASGNFAETSSQIHRFHRTQNVRAGTSSFSLAMAKRFGNSFAVGFGLGYVQIEELTQEYQDVQSTTGSTRIQLTQNRRILLTGAALEPSLGFQATIFGSLSLGLNIKMPQMISESYQSSFENNTYGFEWACKYVESSTVKYDTGKTCAEAGRSGTDVQNPKSVISRSESEIIEKKPLGGMPMSVRLGMAWFATSRFLWTFDVMNHSATKSGNLAIFKREAVTNFATGFEYYTTPSLPLRIGIFTNNDARPEVDENKSDQDDHIDYTGLSLFLAMVQPNSQVAFGSILQSGKGKAQKAGGYAVQDVKALATTLAFSATHNF